MAQDGARARSRAVDQHTGEIVQLELLGSDAFERTAKQSVAVRYDWRPYPGRHVNVAKALMAKVWHKDSGYKQNDRDVLGYYIAHSPEGAAPLRMTFKEISDDLGVRQNTVSQSVGRLNRGGLLLEAEKFGRVRFFKLNPRAAFDGSASAQLEATKQARHPVVPAPAAPNRKRRAS